MYIFMLMSFYRKHIIKITFLLLFAVGIMLVVWPGQNRTEASESVSSWLLDLRSDTDNPVVLDKISSLRTEKDDVPGLLRKASTIISEHSDDFTIPVDSNSSSDDDIYNTLLIKWSLHQQEGGTNTVMITDRQTEVTKASEKDNTTVWSQITNSTHFVVGTYSRISDIWEYIRMILRPMVSGIAIGAP